jgi:hypothetical protein
VASNNMQIFLDMGSITFLGLQFLRSLDTNTLQRKELHPVGHKPSY